MNMNEMMVALSAQFPGSVMVRRSKQNFLAVPGEVNEDGVQTYYAVKLSALLAKDTKTNKAFDVDAAQQEYAEYMAEQATKATAPKKAKGADPAKQAEKEKRKGALLAWFVENPGEHTCSEVLEALPEVYEGKTVMTVGSDAKELATEGTLVKRTEKGKNYYAVA
jgi:hypothetical protein